MNNQKLETTAYFKWKKRGSPLNDDWMDWFAAEKELAQVLYAQSEFDMVDKTLFETLQWIAENEQRFSLWGEATLSRPYTVTRMPVYFIRRDSNYIPVKAYLINFPFTPAGAIEVIHDFPGLGQIYRYDNEMSKLLSDELFSTNFNLTGRPTYAFAYNEQNMNREPLSSSNLYTRLDDWVNMFVHEGFHHYQSHAPDADWRVYDWGGGLSLNNYPVTSDNIALYLLELHTLLAGRDYTSTEDKVNVLRRVLAIRHLRTELPEAIYRSIMVTEKSHGQGVSAPDGIGQSFTADETGEIETIWIDVLAFEDSNARLELQNDRDNWLPIYSQNITLKKGKNKIRLNTPFSISSGNVYAIGIFPQQGDLSLWSSTNTVPGREAFFIKNLLKLRIAPTPVLAFGLSIRRPNYVDRMDRYQERVEGSATYATQRLFTLSENKIYAQESLEMLNRATWTDYQKSRGELIRTLFQGGWYHSGSTMLDLICEVTDMEWKKLFPEGGNPIGLLETLYGPLTKAEIVQLVKEAKQAYNWEAIMEQVALIPVDYLDKMPS